MEELYAQVQDWLRDMPFTMLREPIQIDEENGQYEIAKLVIQDSQQKRGAELIPIGSNIIGADGRVDMVGLADRQILIYLGQPSSFASSIALYKQPLRHQQEGWKQKALEPGWFWTERTLITKIYPLEQELVVDLLTEVSNYAFP